METANVRHCRTVAAAPQGAATRETRGDPRLGAVILLVGGPLLWVLIFWGLGALAP